MARHDPQFDNIPRPPVEVRNTRRSPSVTALRNAIAGSAFAASYPTTRLETMSKLDLEYACKVHGIQVTVGILD